MYELLLREIEEASRRGVKVDIGIRHSILFGVAFFYFIVSIVSGNIQEKKSKEKRRKKRKEKRKENKTKQKKGEI